MKIFNFKETFSPEEEITRLSYYLRKVNDKETKVLSKKTYFMSHNAFVMPIAALLVILVDLFWLIAIPTFIEDVFGLSAPMTKAALFTQIAMSIVVIVLSFVCRKKKYFTLLRIIYLIFDFVLLFGVFAVTISRDNLVYETSLVHAGDWTKFISPCLICYFILIICITPLPSIWGSALLFIALVASLLLPSLDLSINPGFAVYPKYSYLLIGICFVMVYVCYYFFLKRGSALNDSLELISYTDQLTSVLNRRALDTFWDFVVKINPDKKISGMIFDIDNFKSYNDTYSHPKGDKVLKDICGAIYNALDDEDLMFRYGGEEIIILCPEMPELELIKKALKLRQAVIALNVKRDDGKKYPYVTITIGCATVNKDQDYISILDKQLYIGKNGPKNCVAIRNKIYEE